MIYEYWNRIAYMVQLIGACLVFVLPAHKRKHCAARMIFCSLVLIAVSYVLNTVYPQGLNPSVGKTNILWVIYWFFYVFGAIIFVWSGIESTISGIVYCAICACTVQHIAFDCYMIFRLIWKQENWQSGIAYLLIYIVVYLVSYLFVGNKLIEYGKFKTSRESLFPIVTIILLVWVLSVLETTPVFGFESSLGNHLIYRIIDMLCCYYVLWVQQNQRKLVQLQQELDGINNAWNQQTKQHQVTMETIDSINRKCHDLKHQIRALRHMEDAGEREEFLDELEDAIMIYDTALKTGNKALDTILMDKDLFCKNHDIQWSCMADGSELNFMKLEDIYAIFGNALDNAIEAVMDLQDSQKRIIGVKVITQNELVVIQIQNYYEKELQFQDGIPITTKKNKRDHGFGMKSIRYTAEKYNGTITVQARDGIFMLQILLPVRDYEEKSVNKILL